MQTIYLDISNKGVVPTVYAKQGDVGRKFLVVLTDSGVPYSLPAGSVFSVWYEGDSGEGNYTDIGEQSAFSINENAVTVEMIEQMLSVAGNGILCLTLNKADGGQIGSWNIPYVCERIPGFESEEATSYYTAFSETVKNLQKMVETDPTVPAWAKQPQKPAYTAVEVGAAPAGYGLGEGATEIDSWANAVRNGYYRYSYDTPDGNGNGWHGIVANYSTALCNQFVWKTWDAGTRMATRRVYDGVAEPWEWGNPPMIPGVEYRTTERYNGKPVYVQRVDFESLPANTYKEKQFTTDYVTNVVEINAVASHDGTYRRVETLSGVTDLSVKRSVGQALVTVTTNTVLSQYYAYITIKYTKD